MSPLPIQGRQADGIANVVKVLLEHFQLQQAYVICEHFVGCVQRRVTHHCSVFVVHEVKRHAPYRFMNH
jgi:hypothetical protein